jgi:hypothetical protein
MSSFKNDVSRVLMEVGISGRRRGNGKGEGG